MNTPGAGIQAALDSGIFTTKILVEIGMDAPIYLTSHYKDIPYDSKTWDSSAHLFDIPAIPSSTLAKNSRLTLTLSGVDQAYFSLFLSNDYINKEVILSTVFLDDADSVIDSAIEQFQGRIVDVAMAVNPKDGKAIASIIIGDPFDDFGKKSGRRTNTESQKSNFATTDKGFDFTNQAADANLKWGQ